LTALGPAPDDQLLENSEGCEDVPELQRQTSEPLVHKKYGDSSEDTTLESELAERGVGRLVVTGAQTDACIRATIHGAFTRCPPDKVIAHTNMYWTWQEAPGRLAGVVDSVHVTFDARPTGTSTQRLTRPRSGRDEGAPNPAPPRRPTATPWAGLVNVSYGRGWSHFTVF
jgi:hypothetical protein